MNDLRGCNRYQCKHEHESERNDHCRLDTYARLDVFDICDDRNSVTVTVAVDDYSIVTDYDEDMLINCDSDLTATRTPTPVATETSTVTPSSTGTSSTPAPTSTPMATPSSTDSAAGPSAGTEWTVEVVRVVDGDTMEVRFPNGEVDTLRLLGVYTPETFGQNDPAEFEGIPESTAGRDHLANWGDQATEFATDELDGQPVRIEVDPQADRRSSYGRLLVYLYYDDGTDFDRQLIDRGLARMYDSSFSKRSDYTDAEAKAQREDVGL